MWPPRTLPKPHAQAPLSRTARSPRQPQHPTTPPPPLPWQVRGEIHHDRRLHQLMLQEEVNQVSHGQARRRLACPSGPRLALVPHAAALARHARALHVAWPAAGRLATEGGAALDRGLPGCLPRADAHPAACCPLQWSQGVRLRTVDEELPTGVDEQQAEAQEGDAPAAAAPAHDRPASQQSMGSDGSGPSDSALSLHAEAALQASGFAAKVGSLVSAGQGAAVELGLFVSGRRVQAAGSGSGGARWCSTGGYPPSRLPSTPSRGFARWCNARTQRSVARCCGLPLPPCCSAMPGLRAHQRWLMPTPRLQADGGAAPPALTLRSPKHDRPQIDIDYRWVRGRTGQVGWGGAPRGGALACCQRLRVGPCGGPRASDSCAALPPGLLVPRSSDCDYWIISIKCRDRTKLLFDTGASQPGGPGLPGGARLLWPGQGWWPVDSAHCRPFRAKTLPG